MCVIYFGCTDSDDGVYWGAPYYLKGAEIDNDEGNDDVVDGAEFCFELSRISLSVIGDID